MALQAIIFLSLSIIIFVLLIINVVLLLYFYKTNKKIDQLLEKGKIKDFRDIFLLQKEKNDDLENKINDAFLKIKNLEDTCEITIQKIGVVRFNPFDGIGGNQSFTIALLDNKNNGFLISSLFGKDGSRVYAKTVKQGKSDYSLSKEEVEAIDRAIGAEKSL